MKSHYFSIQNDLQQPLLQKAQNIEDKAPYKITIHPPVLQTPLDIRNLAVTILAFLNMKDLNHYLMVNKLCFIYCLTFLKSNQSKQQHQEALLLINKKIPALLQEILGSNFDYIDEKKIEISFGSLEKFKSMTDLPLTLFNLNRLDNYVSASNATRSWWKYSCLTLSFAIATGGFIGLCTWILPEPNYLIYTSGLINGLNVMCCLNCLLSKCLRAPSQEQAYNNAARSILSSLEKHTQSPKLTLLISHMIWRQNSGATPMPERINLQYRKFCDELKLHPL